MTELDEHRFFDATLSLARLPWFGLAGGRLVLEDRSVGPIVDVHTHLALSYVRRRSVDLRAAPGPTQHYLPVDGPLDMDVYQNKNFTDTNLSALKHDLGLGCLTRRGMRQTHTAPNLAREMQEMGVAISVLLPIDLPILSRNAEDYLSIAAEREEILSLGSVHPFQRRITERLERQKRAGALGLKVHPAIILLPPNHPRMDPIYRACADLGLPVLWHCGPVGIEGKRSRACCQLPFYVEAVAAHPETTFVLGHSGALQMEAALELAKRHDNVHLELASQSLGGVRTILREGPVERVMYGSDWPFYHQGIGIAKVLLATEDRQELRPLIFRENAARLFGLTLPEAAA